MRTPGRCFRCADLDNLYGSVYLGGVSESKYHLKKFDLDRELVTLRDWQAYGVVWKKYRPDAGVREPDCTAEQPCLREGWYRFGGPKTQPIYQYLDYTVSNGHQVIAQGFDNAFHARLIASAPELLRFVKSIAEGDALALSVVDDAKSLLKEIRQAVPSNSLHDSTGGPYDPADYPDREWWKEDTEQAGEAADREAVGESGLTPPGSGATVVADSPAPKGAP
jgi:hypothetical protein